MTDVVGRTSRVRESLCANDAGTFAREGKTSPQLVETYKGKVIITGVFIIIFGGIPVN